MSDNVDCNQNMDAVRTQLNEWGKNGDYVIAIELGMYSHSIDFDKNSVLSIRVRDIEELSTEVIKASHKFMGKHLK